MKLSVRNTLPRLNRPVRGRYTRLLVAANSNNLATTALTEFDDLPDFRSGPFAPDPSTALFVLPVLMAVFLTAVIAAEAVVLAPVMMSGIRLLAVILH